MENRIYGYARVSSKDQNEDRQIDSLRAFGVDDENIIVEVIPHGCKIMKSMVK